MPDVDRPRDNIKRLHVCLYCAIARIAAFQAHMRLEDLSQELQALGGGDHLFTAYDVIVHCGSVPNGEVSAVRSDGRHVVVADPSAPHSANGDSDRRHNIPRFVNCNRVADVHSCNAETATARSAEGAATRALAPDTLARS